MPKPRMTPELEVLEREIVSTLMAGHKQFRPDLHYPESHSDMQAAVRNLLRMFNVERRDTPRYLEMPCPGCEGLGKLILETNKSGSFQRSTICSSCQGNRTVKF